MNKLMRGMRMVAANWKTTACGLLIFGALGLRVRKLIDREDMLTVISLAGGAGFLTSQDVHKKDEHDTEPTS